MKEKNLKSNIINIPISGIDMQKIPFCMSFNFDLGPLKESIEEFGILNPPYLLKNSDNTFIVVAGYKRLLAIRELGWQDTACRILPNDFPRLNALLLNLNDNFVHRQLNTIEKGMVLESLSHFLADQEIIDKFMPMLGIPSQKQALALYVSLNELEESIKISVAEKRLSLRVAGLMIRMNREDRLKINNLFTSLRWSSNQQWKAVQWISEIASREGRSIKECIDDAGVPDILRSDRMNNPQKVKAIAEVLKLRRFPSLSEADRLFKKGISRLCLPRKVKIIPPAFFEGTEYRFEIGFSKGEELKRKLGDVSNIAGLEKVTDFWKGLQ